MMVQEAVSAVRPNRLRGACGGRCAIVRRVLGTLSEAHALRRYLASSSCAGDIPEADSARSTLGPRLKMHEACAPKGACEMGGCDGGEVAARVVARSFDGCGVGLQCGAAPAQPRTQPIRIVSRPIAGGARIGRAPDGPTLRKTPGSPVSSRTRPAACSRPAMRDVRQFAARRIDHFMVTPAC